MTPAAAPAALRLRGHALRPPEPGRPLLMGIVNASPDSFSDGGRYPDARAQAERGRELAAAGAAIVDVGGESGVTDRPPVSAEEEIERVLPVVRELAAGDMAISIDTWKPEVAHAALAAGAAMVNDVSGLRDPELADACAAHGAGLVLVHTRVPPKVKGFPRYDDVVADVKAFLAERIELALARGVPEEGIALDPGPDLAKTPAETVEVLRRLGELHELGRPLLLAASRKDFIGAIAGRRPAERLAGTLAAVEAGVAAGASILRVHDVEEVADYLRVRATLRGELTLPPDLRLEERLRREPPPPGAGTQEEPAA